MMVIKNISIEDGICNGTRVQILEVDQASNIILCRILSGRHKGELYALPRVRFEYGADARAPGEGRIKCERWQFPLRPGSAITINKAQGGIIFAFFIYI